MTGGVSPVAAFVPNVFDQPRFTSRSEPSVVFVKSVDEALVAGAKTVLVDLDRCDDVESFVAHGLRAIGFGSHVDHDRLESALESGFAETMPRSVFFRRLPEILDEAGQS